MKEEVVEEKKDEKNTHEDNEWGISLDDAQDE